MHSPFNIRQTLPSVATLAGLSAVDGWARSASYRQLS
jgi:hypothetical protein